MCVPRHLEPAKMDQAKGKVPPIPSLSAEAGSGEPTDNGGTNRVPLVVPPWPKRKYTRKATVEQPVFTEEMGSGGIRRRLLKITEQIGHHSRRLGIPSGEEKV